MADELIVKDESNYERPPEGQFHAVCCDVIDLGFQYNRKFNKVEHKCALVFQLAEKSRKTGKRYEIAQRFTVSFGDKANLRKFLSTWRGKSYSEDEARAGAPLHKLEGVNVYLSIEHRHVGEKTYADINGIMKPPAGLPTLTIEEYTRGKGWKKQSKEDADRQAFREAPPTVVSDGNAPPPPSDDDYAQFPAALDDDPDSSLPF